MQERYSVRIEKSIPKGKVICPPSKSMAHRLLIAASLADGESVIENLSFSEDICATIDCLKELFSDIRLIDNTAYISKKSKQINIQKERTLYPRESGSTLRFLIPLCLLDGKRTSFIGMGRLMQRPLEIYENICMEQGIYYKMEGDRLTLSGKLKSGVFKIRGDVSSQFITGLLFTLPLLDGDSEIILTTPLESKSYLDLTFNTLDMFGIKYEIKESSFKIFGNQKYIPQRQIVEGDHSNAAFFGALDAFFSNIEIEGLNEKSLQGDRVWQEHIKDLKRGYTEISLADCPDLGPILMTVAAEFNGAAFKDTKRLKIKESDRGLSMQEELQKFGASITIEENRITVKKTALHPPKVNLNSHNDHRIAMSLAVLSTLYGGEISGAEAVKKSLPDFFEILEGLGVGLKKTDTE